MSVEVVAMSSAAKIYQHHVDYLVHRDRDKVEIKRSINHAHIYNHRIFYLDRNHIPLRDTRLLR
jgi:hypothetical protein